MATSLTVRRLAAHSRNPSVTRLADAGSFAQRPWLRRRIRSMGDLFPEPDPFDPTLNLEETHIKEGYNEGYNDGLVTGREEGRLVGLKDGFMKGEELGFYRGCVDVWNSAIRVDPSHFSTRVQKSVKAMESLLEKYPFMDPENEKIQDILNDLRLKFRAICASLGVKLEYEGYPGGGDTKDISF